MLTATEITERIGSGEIGWQGEMRGDGLLLRLGAPLQPLNRHCGVVDLSDQVGIDTLYAEPDFGWHTTDLEPGRLVLCAAAMPLRLAAGLAAAIGTLSHLARTGLAAHLSTPWVLPGWDGFLTLELVNCGPATLRLRRGMPAARVVVFGMTGAAEHAVPHRHYGGRENLGSRYATEFSHELGAVSEDLASGQG